MKKFLLIMFLVAASSYATLQYKFLVENPWEGKVGTAPITMKITEGGSLWFSSYVSNWEYMDDLGKAANMTAGNYGAVVNGKTTVKGTGETEKITFGKGKVSGIGYFAGNFDAGDEISFWITTNDDVVGSSVEPISKLAGQLATRQILDKPDLANNKVIDFGFNKYGNIQFVGSGGEYYKGSPSGQPLPGAFAALLLGGGVLGSLGYSRRKHA